MLTKHKKTPGAIRSELLQLVREDLLGPKDGPEEEIGEASVVERYVLGRLAPRDSYVEPEELDELGAEEADSFEDGETESKTKLGWALHPSSMGMSFTVEEGTEAIVVQARWGEYERAKSEEQVDEKDRSKLIWKRNSIEGPLLEIPIQEGPIVPRAASLENPLVKIRGQIRRRPGEAWFVSLFLDNQQVVGTDHKESYWLFQAELAVFGKDGQMPFVRRTPGAHTRRWNPILEDEERVQELNYRHHLEFAVGHGVGVNVKKSVEDPTRAGRITTAFAPAVELPETVQAEPDTTPGLAGLVLDMQQLSEMDDAALFSSLEKLPDAYADWIEANRARLTDPELHEHQAAAGMTLNDCQDVCDRIRAGITALKENPEALEAFRFSNRSMYLQRIRTQRAESVRTGNPRELADLDVSANRSWRLFQLGFILLNLPALIDVTHQDRSANVEALADLLWFPTGGGKTEAYLGLTAFALAIRRLQGKVEGRSGEDGVAVLMRYTLRLLTLQQFQRSAALICAAETIRREKIAAGDTRWGQTPFRIGLWVGKRTTPNRTIEGEEALLSARGQSSNFSYSGTPHQLSHCPWCGRVLTTNDFEVEKYRKGRGRTIAYCSDPTGQCEFGRKNSDGEGIPVVVVDEEIYRLLPALVIATVDKFAQMPWEGPVQMLFGQVDRYCPRHGFGSPDLTCGKSHPKLGKFPAVKIRELAPLRPPDLIIQDELHLIAGPLGTLVGLYETAVDELCKWEVNGVAVRPKVIASTATIRLAQEQLRRIFARTGRVFPPPGLDVSDNFFAQQRPPSDEHPGRLYLGVNAIGERVKVILIRVYLAFLSAAKQLHNTYGEDADPYMTLVGYFNSLRELGGMRRLVEDDINSRLYKMDRRGLTRRRGRLLIEELTSRKTATDIPDILARLEIPHKVEPVPETDEGVEPEKPAKKKSEKSAGRRAIDVLLATNMISVGVDVKRFGLMVVAGQPKTTAEYIQATSRIGRQVPGIVCTVYNWSRPRDISHYERFEHYHETFYKHVEANSVTPFSSRALDRGLSGVLAGMVRLLGPDLNANLAAGRLRADSTVLQRAQDALRERIGVVSPETAAELDRMLQRVVGKWLRAEDGANTLSYKRHTGDVVPLLVSAGKKSTGIQLSCLNSLREVEPPTNLIIQDEQFRDNE